MSLQRNKQSYRKAKEAAEVTIDDEMLASIDAAAESLSESNASEVNEVVFTKLISPPRGTIVPSAIPVTPVASRKRTLTPVHHTPDKPRTAPVLPTTPST
jgi:hypothetical protein